jgi:hypothetical protein
MKPYAMVLCFSMMVSLGCSQPEDNSCSVRGSSCSDSYECCGDDVCDGWQCVALGPACTATDNFCMNHTDCCNFDQGTGWCVDNICKDSCLVGSNCVSGCCAPTSISGVSTCADASYCVSCLPVRGYCTSDLECCGTMLCDPGMLTCCVQYGLGCVYDNDCCGVMLCYGGTCA